MENEIQNIQYQIQQLGSKIDKLENSLTIQQNNNVSMMQAINMQISALNQINQTILNFSNKLADMEININGSDDYVKDLIDSQNNILTEIQDLKNAVEAMKFYSLNQGGNYNYNP